MSEAAHPTDAVAICNLALARLGHTKPIASLIAPQTPTEDLCALHYPVTRRRLLRGGVFNFAKKYALITLDGAVTPAFGFSGAYGLPNDFLRLLTLGDVTAGLTKEPTAFDVVGRHIYTSDEDSEDTLNLYYIFDETNVGRWDATFVNLMRLELASDMAPGIQGIKPSVLAALAAELKDVRLEAKAVAGQEKPPVRVQRSRWRDNRRLGGMFRDSTRHPI